MNYLVYIMPFIPYAVIILCFVGSCRSLSHSSKEADSSGSSVLCGDQLHISNSPLANLSFFALQCAQIPI